MFNIKDYYDLNLTVTEVHLAVSKKCSRGWKLNTNCRKGYGLVFILNGGAEYIFEDKTVYGKKYDVIYFKDGDSYKTNAIGDENLEYIVITFDVLQEKSMNMLPFDTVNTTSRPMRFEELFRYIEEIWYMKSIGYRFQTSGMMQSLIFELLQDKVSIHFSSKSLTGIKAAADYMESCYDKDIDVNNLALISGYSVSHYRKKFKEIYGMPPVVFLNNIRVEKAKDLLKSRMYSIDEIAKICGFDNIYYFGKVFKKYTGTTPRKY